MLKKLGFIFITPLFFLLDSCVKEPTPADVSEIDNFIWTGLSKYYLWENVAPHLSDAQYQNKVKRNSFINGYNGDHEALFEALLYKRGVVDRFSWIVDDYIALANLLNGVQTTMGFEYGLVKIENTNNVFGFVQYVLPDSPASQAGIKRGNFFTKIDGQQLTTTNVRNLLRQSSYSLTITNDITSTNGVDKNLTAVQLQENPVYLSKVIDVGGVKVGYLVYNGFYRDFNDELNDAFLNFKNQGIQELILDFRYNGGGSVETAIYLASMIYSKDKSKVFCKSQYNNAVQTYLVNKYGVDHLNNYFTDTAKTYNNSSFVNTIPINSLGLSKVHIICSKGTASASELIINGLKPYVDVVLIGTKTYGKYVGSITLKDTDANGIVNPNHKWAMQPIILKIANSQNVSDYIDGFKPNIEIKENYHNMSVLGDETEPLLKTTLDYIKGIQSPVAITHRASSFNLETVGDSKDLKMMGKDMYIDNSILLNIN